MIVDESVMPFAEGFVSEESIIVATSFALTSLLPDRSIACTPYLEGIIVPFPFRSTQGALLEDSGSMAAFQHPFPFIPRFRRSQAAFAHNPC
ncbi:hypothetical protein [Sphingomonas sp. YR710]|uniref:hypothetical protein n=1 Tax=Sphingomonas sp. YR710 TaxID=1882773 RepID=UPI0015A3B565|nr:hypothetical protein [Sphingomonas sp. YR710]